MYRNLLAILPMAGVLAVAIPASTTHAAMTGALALPAGEVTQKSKVIKVARRGRGFRGGRAFRGRGIRRRGIRRGRGFRRGFRRGRRFGPAVVLGFGAPAFYYGYRYARGCNWLRRRALNTGSRYWWRRYDACRYGY